MTDIVRIGAAFALIVLLRLRWDIGLVVLVATVFLVALYRSSPREQAI